MEELREKYAQKKAEMREEYADVINEISTKHNVDVGVAFDMLLATCRGGDYADGFDFDREGLQKEYEELLDLSVQIANSL